MPSPRQQFGSWAESVAEDFLRRKNFIVLARHVTSRYGEIDILAMDGNVAVVVEVKARRNNNFGRAVEGITLSKLTRLGNTVEEIMGRSYWPENRIRIDVVTVEPYNTTHYIGWS